jgi:hypothetical protein
MLCSDWLWACAHWGCCICMCVCVTAAWFSHRCIQSTYSPLAQKHILNCCIPCDDNNPQGVSLMCLYMLAAAACVVFVHPGLKSLLPRPPCTTGCSPGWATGQTASRPGLAPGAWQATGATPATHTSTPTAGPLGTKPCACHRSRGCSSGVAPAGCPLTCTRMPLLLRQTVGWPARQVGPGSSSGGRASWPAARPALTGRLRQGARPLARVLLPALCLQCRRRRLCVVQPATTPWRG